MVKVKETCASPDAMDEDQPSNEEPEEDELAMRPKGQKAKKAKSKVSVGIYHQSLADVLNDQGEGNLDIARCDGRGFAER